jgi:formylglycine-generating enzyme required for sulfatase activity
MAAAVTVTRSVRAQGVPGSKSWDSTALDVAATVTLRKLSGFSAAGAPIYDETVQHRIFTLENGDDALVPFLVPDSREKSDFGIREIMLQIDTRVVAPPAAEYGALSIRSDSAGAAIRLDGGLVDRTSANRTAFLRNVPVGEHEVRIREASGLVTRRVVHVRKDRTIRIAPDAPLAKNRLERIGRNDRGYDEYRRVRDGAVMVRVPEGEFHMGNLATEGQPKPHTVFVSTFLIDKTPVTWGQYGRFLEATGWPLPPDEPYWGIHEDQPAVFVTWEESRAYCEWVGGRLPREAEREKAARGTDERKYPWGDEEPDPTLATFRHNWGYEASTSVGSHPAGASPYGLLDMAGNVWEWCEDWWDPDYFQVSPSRDPAGPARGRAHVVKGGSWDSRPSVLSASARNFGYIGDREGDYGFRCAADPGGAEPAADALPSSTVRLPAGRSR